MFLKYSFEELWQRSLKATAINSNKEKEERD